MHKMSSESASTLYRLQSRLDTAEIILKLVLDKDNNKRDYLISLVTTYFSRIKGMEVKDEKTI